MTLQDMIDAAFGAQEKAPPPQAPSEASKERDRAFADRAKRIESLRAARLTNAAEPGLAPLLFEVVRIRGHWRTRHASKESSSFPDQASAIAAARKLAIAKRKQGHAVKVVLQRTDGKEVVQPIDDEAGQSGGE
jgi:predicted DNA-binding WGR domain protein